MVLCRLLGKLNWGVTFYCIGFCTIGDWNWMFACGWNWVTGVYTGSECCGINWSNRFWYCGLGKSDLLGVTFCRDTFLSFLVVNPTVLVALGAKIGWCGAQVCTVDVTGCLVCVGDWFIAVSSFGCTPVASCFIFGYWNGHGLNMLATGIRPFCSDIFNLSNEDSNQPWCCDISCFTANLSL